MKESIHVTHNTHIFGQHDARNSLDSTNISQVLVYREHNLPHLLSTGVDSWYVHTDVPRATAHDVYSDSGLGTPDMIYHYHETYTQSRANGHNERTLRRKWAWMGPRFDGRLDCCVFCNDFVSYGCFGGQGFISDN